MGLTIIQVDAFSDRPFGGNPAAVCVQSEPLADELMLAIAREMNLSETAFLHPQADGYRLRWFTPTVEVDLCGHATLASAHVLWTEGHLAPDTQARFHTNSGLLTATRRGEWIELDFPVTPEAPIAITSDLINALAGAAVGYVGQNKFDYLVELRSEAEVRSLQPNLAALKALPVRGVIVTSQADPGQPYDFVSRFFAPGAGIDEDPVTGSAHCCLAPFWQQRLGKAELLGYQASARGGWVKVRCQGDRVLLSGQAVTVLRGELQTSV